ncbi:MAG: hypothetical protein ACI8RD_010948 [Bacillariaceae sp.]|jgi:hypothetical protein
MQQRQHWHLSTTGSFLALSKNNDERGTNVEHRERSKRTFDMCYRS